MGSHSLWSKLGVSMLAGFVLTSGSQAIAQQNKSPQQDELLEVVKETLETNPEIQIRLQAFRASVHDRREAFGGYLPKVDLEASAGRANRDFDGRGTYHRHYGEISLTQMLFDGFRVRNAVAKAKHTSRARYFDLLAEAETKAMESSEVYLQVLQYREMVKLAQENLANHLRVQQHIGERVSRGISNRADLQQIEGRVSLARANLMTEVANLQTVTARFERLVGRYPAEELTPYEFDGSTIPRSLTSVLSTVYSNNPELYAAYENILSNERAHKEAKAGRYPIFELGARHGAYRGNNSFDRRTDPEKYGEETIVELRARYNLYRGGSDRAAERATFRRINQAESMRDKTCVDLRQYATISHSDALNLEVKMDALKRHQEEAEKVLNAYREQFDIGRRSLLDVLDSENEYFQARRAYTSGSYELLLNRLYTLHSMGLLLSTLSDTNGEEELPYLDQIDDSVKPGNSRFCTLPDENIFALDRYMGDDGPVEMLTLGADTLFDVGKHALKPGAREQIEEFAERLIEQGSVKSIVIAGHTDNTGSDALNRKLSLDRARTVRDVLVNSGIDEGIIRVSGLGPYQPAATNDNAEGRALNRRVEVRVIHHR